MKNSKLVQILNNLKDPILNTIEDWGIGLAIQRNISKINAEMSLIDEMCKLHEKSSEYEQKHNDFLVSFSKKDSEGKPVSQLIHNRDEEGNPIPPYYTRYDIADEDGLREQLTVLQDIFRDVIDFNEIQNDKRNGWNESESSIELQKIKQSYITDKVERSKLWAKPFDLSRLQIIKLSDIIDFEN